MRTRIFRGARPVVGGAAAVVALVVVGAATAGAQANPPGNNGTVKVDGVVFDDHPDNEPHPGCTFQIDFYGFDEGDLYADVTFEAVDPTAQTEPLLTDTVFIGEDDNSGGGSEEGLDASATYDLTEALDAIAPHPEQGWHVKLTVHADGSQGADTKHKVFWVSDCGSDEPPTSSSSTTDPTTSTTDTTPDASTTTVSITPGASTTVVPGGDAPGGPSEPQSPPDASVDVNPTSSSGGLPVTGSSTTSLVALAAALLGVGAAAAVVARRFRTTDG